MAYLAGIVVTAAAVIGFMVFSIDRDADPITGERPSISDRIVEELE